MCLYSSLCVYLLCVDRWLSPTQVMEQQMLEEMERKRVEQEQEEESKRVSGVRVCSGFVIVHVRCVLPYSVKFSWGANFAFFEGRTVNEESKTGINSHASVFHMQSYWWVWFPGIETRILEPTNISLEPNSESYNYIVLWQFCLFTFMHLWMVYSALVFAAFNSIAPN